MPFVIVQGHDCGLANGDSTSVLDTVLGRNLAVQCEKPHRHLEMDRWLLRFVADELAGADHVNSRGDAIG